MFSSMDELLAAFDDSQQILAPAKYGATNQVSAIGQWASSWLMTGSYLPSTPPGTPGEQCSRSTTGAIPFTAAGTGKALYLARFAFSPNQAVGVFLMDRLYHCHGLSGTVTTTQTVNNGTVSLPARGGTGEGVELWLEWNTATGSTAVNATVSYTNQNGVSGRTGVVALTATMRARNAMRVPLQTGDTGVRSVESVTLSATTGTAGGFGVVLAKRVVTLPNSVANAVAGAGPFALGIPKIDPNACLFFIIPASATTSPSFDTELLFINGPE
jgi:hypothetical protein